MSGEKSAYDEACDVLAKSNGIADAVDAIQEVIEDNRRLQKLNESLVARCAGQAEVIARNAERRQCQEWPADMVNAKTE